MAGLVPSIGSVRIVSVPAGVISEDSQKSNIAFIELNIKEDKFKPTLSLSKAKGRFKELQEGTEPLVALSPAIYLEIDLFKKLNSLKRNSDLFRIRAVKKSRTSEIKEASKLFDKCILELLIIFRSFRKRSLFNKKDALEDAKEAFSKLWESFSEIKQFVQGVAGRNKFLDELENCHDSLSILYHLTQAEEFLDPALKTTDRGISSYTPATVQLYEEGVILSEYSSHLLQQYIKEEWTPLCDQAVQKLEKLAKGVPGVETLATLFKSYQKDTGSYIALYAQELPSFMSQVRSDPRSKDLAISADFLNIEYLIKAIKSSEALAGLNEIWEGKAVHFTTLSTPLNQKLPLHEQLILKQCASLSRTPELKSLATEITALIQKRKRTTLIVDSLGLDTFRIPSLIMQQLPFKFSLQNECVSGYVELYAKFKQQFPFQMQAVTVFQLLVFESLRILDGFPDDEKKENAKRILTKLVSSLTTLELWDTFQNSDHPLLKNSVKKFIKQFHSFTKSMHSFCDQESPFLQLLKKLDFYLPADNKSEEKVAFSLFNSFLYHTVGGSLEPNQTERDLQYFKELFQRSLRVLNGTIKGFSKDIEQPFNQLEKHPEASQLPHTIWKQQRQIVKLLKSQYGRIQKFIGSYQSQIPECSSIQELVALFRTWDREVSSSLDRVVPLANLQISLLVCGLDRELTNSLMSLMKKMGHQINFYNMLCRPLFKIEEEYEIESPELSEKPPRKKAVPLIRKPVESDEDVVEDLELTAPVHTYEPTPYENLIEPLLQLQRHGPIPLGQQEEPLSYADRKVKMERAIDTHLYLLALLEEEREGDALPTLMRGSLDSIRLQEMTEKLAVAYFPLRSGSKHILVDQPELFSSHHDGVKIVKLLSQTEPLFQEMPCLEEQEPILKKAFWFREKMPTLADEKLILPSCQKIWSKMAKTKSKAKIKLEDLYDTFKRSKKILDRQRRQLHQNSFAIPEEVAPLENAIDKTLDLTKKGTLKESVEEICSLAKALHTEKSPIRFTNRHAEVQVCLLSTVLQIVLSKFPALIETEEGLKHALECDHEGKLEGRPLIHSHNVLHLWKALKTLLKSSDASMEAKLALFVGDPRYPYPNKTAISDDLVTAFELSRLREFAKRAFHNQTTLRLFRKYFPDFVPHTSAALLHEPIEQKLKDHLAFVERKTSFAFTLALEILEMAPLELPSEPLSW